MSCACTNAAYETCYCRSGLVWGKRWRNRLSVNCSSRSRKCGERPLPPDTPRRCKLSGYWRRDRHREAELLLAAVELLAGTELRGHPAGLGLVRARVQDLAEREHSARSAAATRSAFKRSWKLQHLEPCVRRRSERQCWTKASRFRSPRR